MFKKIKKRIKKDDTENEKNEVVDFKVFEVETPSILSV